MLATGKLRNVGVGIIWVLVHLIEPLVVNLLLDSPS
jgi:hypothetical protein